MPRRLQGKPTYKKKNYKRRYVGGSLRSSRIGVSGAAPFRRVSVNVPFPKQLFTKLNYVDNRLLQAGSAGAIVYHTYRHNDITDPDQSGLGHQTLYNDQLTGIYESYCVYGCKIVVEIASAYNCNCPVKVTLRCRKDTSAPLDITLEEERLQGKYTMVPNQGQAVKKLQMYMPTGAMFGKTKKQILADDLFSAATSNSTSSPTDQAFWTISAAPMDPAITAAVYVNVKLTYYVKFYERKPQQQS